MKKFYELFVLIFLVINTISSDTNPFTDGTVYTIDDNIDGTTEYKTKTASFLATDQIHYFKYDFAGNLPTSLITAFKLDITPYTSEMNSYKVYCTNVLSTTSDADLITQLTEVKSDETKSTCTHIYQSYGYHDSIMKLDKSKTKIGIAVYMPAAEATEVKINLRIAEMILTTQDEKPNYSESYSMVPITINITSFREAASKILFYSSTRVLQMYETVSSGYAPTNLFSGNILNVYTNPNQIRQKYHDASIMTLLANAYGLKSDEGKLKETFKFEVKLFPSNYLLDYYVSSNPEGRPLNSPLLINMTECSGPYYVILNYNAHDYGKTLILDEIYGKISYLGVATTLESETWEEMIANDIETINLNDKKYSLPSSANNMDVYKVECTLPVMINFYYIDPTAPVSTMNYGDVQIFILQPYQTINVPFTSGMKTPEVIIEINEPEDKPYVIITVTNEKVYEKNTLERFVPITLGNGITIKERGGSSNTRVIIKVGYSTSSWTKQSDYIKYNSAEKTYLFEFPNDALNRYFYTYATLTMSGTNADNNVKFCFTSSIGGALKPSSENCYRVSSTNSYYLKFYNPFIMYKNYEYSADLKYSITLKPVTDTTAFGINPIIEKYNTNKRNYEGVNNKITLGDDGKYSSILTPPQEQTTTIFLQIQICSGQNKISTKVVDVLTQESLLPDEDLPASKTNYYRTFSNKLMDTEFYATGTSGTDVFLRMVGLTNIYIPSFRTEPSITFDNTTNTLFTEFPVTTNENMRITVLVDTEGTLDSKGYTLCSFVDTEFKDMAKYYKTVTIKNANVAYIQLNFNQAGIAVDEKFDALIYYEQLAKGQMVFLSKVVKGTVGEISLDTIYEINEVYSEDNNYVYKTITQQDNSYYFSYLPEATLEVPIGAFSLELGDQTTGELAEVYCSFVANDSDAMTMIEAVESAASDNTSYCLGGVSGTDSRRYNYIFKYEYEQDKTPKKMVIKVVNKNVIGEFSIYMKKDQGEEIVKTDFLTQKEYGKDESSKKSVIPYIVNVETLRGTDENYVSKVLFYSRYLEMQMYYVPTDSNKPIKLFCGNIALVYTKPQLAEQKYHSKILVLITENLEGKVHPTIGSNFRFHTKMFQSDAMIEFFVSQNPVGRTLNFPLSLEMNTCSDNNNKLYYLLNYNEEEPTRRLHLDMLFGRYIRARIAREINQNHWDELLLDSSSMTEIVDFKAELPAKSQHIDVIEVTCATPLLMNAYYTRDDLFYADIERGGVAIKMLPAQSSFSFSFKKYDDQPIMDYTISLYNPTESPKVSVSFTDGTQHQFTGNSLQTGTVMNIPDRVTITNNVQSETRFIFKYGLPVESNWHKDDVEGIDGTLFYNEKTYVYKFPTGTNRRDFTTIDFLVNANDGNTNTKFCYSTNLGAAIETSRENCFRTGTFIPYTLTFINPFIMGKNYYTDTDKYYIAFKPFDEAGSIKLTITENTYSVTNRNELGVAKKLTIQSNEVSSILSMPLEPQNIIFQIQSCTKHNEPIEYYLYNAFTDEFLHKGKIYLTDPFGIYYISTLTYIENKITLLSNETNKDLFTKHAAIASDYTPQINTNYSVTFDPDSNVVNIIKPIIGEQFTITVIVKKTSLEDITMCDLAFTDKSKLGDYVNSFVSTSSDRIIHYIDFSKLDGYPEGTEFYVLVHAEQMKNSQMEFKYPVITGKVGKVSGTVKIESIIEGQTEYIQADFTVKSSSNYLFYDFPRTPTGNVASIRIKSYSARVNKVGCVFVSNTANDDEMINAVNTAVSQDKSVCIGDSYFTYTGFDALVNAKYTTGNNRLVIQIMYGLGENGEEIGDDNTANIVIKNGGTDLTTEGKFPSSEPYSAIPYVIDLIKIRGTKTKDYVSKILFYSNTREMQMFYVTEDNSKPVSLFTGNIMMVYTNPELIKQKYQGATVMILLTDSLSNTEFSPMGEQYRFISYFFQSDANINYFLSSNTEGRPLNNPTAIEMTECTQPYYYIMNYNKVEGERKLHIDTVFGERQSIRLATVLNSASWEDCIDRLENVKGDEVVLKAQSRFHFDIIEVKCSVPLLVNLFYVDPNEAKVTNLETGDITVISLEKGKNQILTFKLGETGPLVYSFTVEKDSTVAPKISITFDDADEMLITQNGVYSKYWLTQYTKITIANKDNSGNVNTRIIFKMGLAIEAIFEKDSKGVYNNQKDTERVYNLYGYIYDQTSTKLNYTGVDFEVSTELANVKFCYSTNLGTYIYPSLQNCYRVGKNNPYTISTLNPNVMYRNYYNDEHMNYYVGFRTVEKDQSIIINPVTKKYDTTERNLEGEKNKLRISSDSGEISTILTAPKNHDDYIVIETCLCTRNAHVSYQFLNAYNKTNLGSNGELHNTSPKISSIKNPKLDTELKILKGQNGYEIFVKHTGYGSNSVLSQQKIVIKYNHDTHVLDWTQPLINENFNYTIYIDKINQIKKQNYTLCDIAEVSKLGHFMDTKVSKERNPNITLDFAKWEIDPKTFGEFDIIIIAEQLEKQKLTFMSATYDSMGGNNEEPDKKEEEEEEPPNPPDDGGNVGLIVVISILSVVIIAGIIAAVFIFMKYRKKTKVIEENKQTSMALLNSTQQDKLVESQVQVDP